jgi:hypothetical protein
MEGFSPPGDLMRTRLVLATALAVAACALAAGCGDERDMETSTAGGGADTFGPHVETISPSSPAELGPEDPIRVTFSEAVDPATVTEQSLTLSVGTGAFRTIQGDVVTIRPDGSWPAGTTITVVVTSAVRDLAGNAADPWSAAVATHP